MKKIIYTALFVLTLSSCGRSQKNEISDSDTNTVAEIATTVDVERRHTYITKDGVGAVLIGTPVNSLPDSMPGLYTSKENGASPDAVTVDFSDENGQQFVAYDFGEGNIDVINLIGTDIYVDAPEGSFGLGAPFSKVLELPGVEAEWSSYDENGMWYWIWEGLWFAPAQENLPEELASKLYRSGQAPDSKDFTEKVTVGFIGTGLPF